MLDESITCDLINEKRLSSPLLQSLVIRPTVPDPDLGLEFSRFLKVLLSVRLGMMGSGLSKNINGDRAIDTSRYILRTKGKGKKN